MSEKPHPAIVRQYRRFLGQAVRNGDLTLPEGTTVAQIIATTDWRKAMPLLFIDPRRDQGEHMVKK